jgi:hypothetical protein
VYVYPQSITYSNQWNVTFTCVETAGIPRPLLVWRRQNNPNPIEQSSKVRIHNGVLTIIKATKDDQGIEKDDYSSYELCFHTIGFYECIGSNTAGEDIKPAQLIYAGIIS